MWGCVKIVNPKFRLNFAHHLTNLTKWNCYNMAVNHEFIYPISPYIAGEIPMISHGIPIGLVGSIPLVAAIGSLFFLLNISVEIAGEIQIFMGQPFSSHYLLNKPPFSLNSNVSWSNHAHFSWSFDHLEITPKLHQGPQLPGSGRWTHRWHLRAG